MNPPPTQPGSNPSPSAAQQALAIVHRAYELQQAGRFAAAGKAYLESLKLNNRDPVAHNNLGNCLRSLGAYEEAIRHFDAALRLEPGRSSSTLNRSLALLSLERYAEAWPGYEQRLSVIDFRSEMLTCDIPQWQGQPLGADETLYIYSNQGLGDELQASRFLPMVVAKGGHVVLEVQRASYPLLKDLPGLADVRIRPSAGDCSIPECDYQCEIFSLPGLLGVDIETLPPAIRPPFSSGQRVRDYLAQQRSAYPEHRHIGLVWSGNPKNDLNPYRACGLVHLLPLLELPQCRFYSLQKGPPRQDLQRYAEQAKDLIDLDQHLTDLAATATAIDELDLVITIDTSVAHLAGTIGAESWILLHQPSDWRWTATRDRTPWYPQLRLFRQEPKGQWVPLLERVKGELVREYGLG